MNINERGSNGRVKLKFQYLDLLVDLVSVKTHRFTKVTIFYRYTSSAYY